ncbi:MAG: OmpA family protein [Deltaproteobacteria bacterium]|nr:OmpA family protein [Kofleriaceae bacterium]
MHRTLLCASLLVLALAACGKKKGPAPPNPTFAEPEADGASRQRGEPGTATVTAVGKDAGDAPAIGPVYFAFDSTELSESSRRELTRYGEWLQRSKAHVVVEGHADERGTTEYNVALGERRAHVIRDFLVRLGVDAARVDTISYGEERPAASGGDESAWAQNRRGELNTRN